MPNRSLRTVLLLLAIIACGHHRPAPGPPEAGATTSSVDAGPAVLLAEPKKPPAKPTRKPTDPGLQRCIDASWDKQSLMECFHALEHPAAPPAEDAGAHKLKASVRPPIVNPAQSVPDWYFSSAGDDNNNTCVAANSPCKTFAEVVARWGTNAPSLAQVTTLHFLTDDVAEVINWYPNILPNGQAIILGTMAVVASGTIGAVHAKAPTTGTPLLTADLGANAAGSQGLMFVNTTHASVSWVDSVSGTVATLVQPFPSNVPAFNALLNEVDTTTSNDSYSLQRPVKVRIGEFLPVSTAMGPAQDVYAAFVGHVWIDDPSGQIGHTTTAIGHLVRLVETRSDTFITYTDSVPVPANNSALSNAWAAGGGALTNTTIVGGAIGTLNTVGSTPFSGVADGDVIFHNGIFAGSSMNNSIVGLGTKFGMVYCDAGLTGNLDIFVVSDTIIQPAYFTQAHLYGSCRIHMSETSSRLTYVAPASSSFFNNIGILFDGSNFANTRDVTVTPEQWYGPIQATIANLDLSVHAGGFGGFAQGDNGATIAVKQQASAAPAPYLNASGAITITQNSPAAGQVTVGTTAASCPVNLASCTTGTLSGTGGGTGLSQSGCPSGQYLGGSPYACSTPPGTSSSFACSNLSSCTGNQLPLSGIAAPSVGSQLQIMTWTGNANGSQWERVGGDIGFTTPSPSPGGTDLFLVTGIQGTPVAGGSPTAKQVIAANNGATQYQPTSMSSLVQPVISAASHAQKSVPASYGTTFGSVTLVVPNTGIGATVDCTAAIEWDVTIAVGQSHTLQWGINQNSIAGPNHTRTLVSAITASVGGAMVESFNGNSAGSYTYNVLAQDPVASGASIVLGSLLCIQH